MQKADRCFQIFRLGGLEFVFVCLAQTWENGGVSSWVADKVAKSILCLPREIEVLIS